MSDTYYGLSKIEYNLMKYFWNTNAPVSFSEVEKYRCQQTYCISDCKYRVVFRSKYCIWRTEQAGILCKAWSD